MTRFLAALAVWATLVALACAPDSSESSESTEAIDARMSSPPSDTLLPVNGTRIFVHREGEGAPLVVIHGGPVLDQTYLREPLRPLASVAELVFYDQRLSGRSHGSVDSASVRLATMVQDLEALRETLDHDRIDILAHSWGGLIGVAYAIEHPDRVGRLILVSPMAPSADLWRQEQTAQAAALEPADTSGVGALRADPGVVAGEPAALAALLRHSFRSQLHEPALAESLDFHIEPDYGERSRQFGFMLPDLLAYDFTDRLAEIRAPTLLIYGAEEPGGPIGGEALRKGIPDVRSVVFPETGHFAFLESPERFLEEVRGFLAR